jgi:hypothetical protein
MQTKNVESAQVPVPGWAVGGRKLGLDGGYKANATVTFLQATNMV